MPLIESQLQSEKTPVTGRWVQVISLVLLMLFGLLFAPGVLELTAFAWEHAQNSGEFAWEMVASRRIDLVISPDAGYTIVKPNSHYEWKHIPVDVNSHGLRDADIPYEKPANTIRVLNLGDSVAMGWGVRQEETYGKQLETMLNTIAPTGARVEVINAGVPGWNPENELAFLQAEGMKYHPDLVVLDVTIVNDIYGQNALVASSRKGMLEWLRKHTYSYSFLSIQKQWIEARAAGKDRIDVIDPPTDAEKYFPLNADASRWDDVWNTISAMNDTAKNNGANFAVVLFPLEFQVVDESFSTMAQTVLSARATAQNIPTIDLLPVFQEACRAKPGGACTREDRYLFADVWMHPSAFGHTVTAQALLPLVENQLDIP